MAKTLTIKAIESAKPKDKEYKLTVDRGLYIRVAINGVKTWLIRYVVDQKQKQYKLPEPFGTVGDGFMSLIGAKAVNAKIQALAHDGIDYVLQRSELQQQAIDDAKQKADEAKTFNDLYDVWIKDGVSRADENKYIKQSFGKHALAALGIIQLRHL